MPSDTGAARSQSWGRTGGGNGAGDGADAATPQSFPPPPRTSGRAEGLGPALRHLSPPPARGEAAGLSLSLSLPLSQPEPEPEPEPRSPAAAAAAPEDAPAAGALTSPATVLTAARGVARSTPGNVVPPVPRDCQSREGPRSLPGVVVPYEGAAARHAGIRSRSAAQRGRRLPSAELHLP